MKKALLVFVSIMFFCSVSYAIESPENYNLLGFEGDGMTIYQHNCEEIYAMVVNMDIVSFEDNNHYDFARFEWNMNNSIKEEIFSSRLSVGVVGKNLIIIFAKNTTHYNMLHQLALWGISKENWATNSGLYLTFASVDYVASEDTLKPKKIIFGTENGNTEKVVRAVIGY